MKHGFLKKFTSLVLVAIMVVSMIPAFAFSVGAADVAGTTVKYTFSDYTAGTQYAENEVHVLDDTVTVTTTQAHFTSELRLYSSSSHDGFAIFESAADIDSIVINAGNKADTLNVYTSVDGSTWNLAEGVSVTSTSYTDYTVTFAEATKYIKLDVAGTNQVRVKYVTITFAGTACTHANTTAIGEAKDATCTEDGITAGVKCADCGEELEAQVIIDALGHKNENPADSKCDTCGTNLCTTHTWIDDEVITEGDCTTARVVSQVCQNCGEPGENKTTPAPGHTEEIDAAVDATCTETGLTEGKHCSVCGEKTIAQETIPATGHTYVDGVCEVCNEKQPTKLTIDRNAFGDASAYAWHSWTATTTTGESISGSGFIYGGAKTSIQMNGSKEGDYIYNTIPLPGGISSIKLTKASGTDRDFDILTSDTPFDSATAASLKGQATDAKKTVTTEGVVWEFTPNHKYFAIVLTDSSAAYLSSIEIEFSVCTHTSTVTVEAKDPTCTEPGYTAGEECAVCGAAVSGCEPIDALGHEWGADGVCTRVCGASKPVTPAAIVDAAYALAKDAILPYGPYTLTGKITEVATNMITIVVDGADATKPIACYKLTGADAYTLNLNDTITVTGTLKNYNGTIEFIDCTLDAYEATGCTHDWVDGTCTLCNATKPVTPEDIVNAAYELAEDATLQYGPYTLTGVITSVDTAFGTYPDAVTVTMIVAGLTDKPIKCFRMSGDGANLIGVGDTITVTGQLKNYYKTIEFDSGCTLDSYVAAAPAITGFSLNLNKDITVNVTCNISAAWLADNAGAKIVFAGAAAEEYDAVAGEKTYSITLTPGQFNGELTASVSVGGNALVTKDVSVNAYTESVVEMSAADLGLTDAQYNALGDLLFAIMDYGKIGETAPSSSNIASDAGTITTTGDADVLGELKATLSENASVQVSVANPGTYTANVMLNGTTKSYGLGDSKSIVLNGMTPARYNDEITITILDSETEVASVTFTFNAYLKALYTSATTDEATKNLAAAVYNYGVAAEAFAVA